MIIDVNCEDDTIQIARIINEHTNTYEINFLEETGKGIYNFSTEVTSIPKEAVSGFYDVETLEETGIYFKTLTGYEPYDDEDEDFECETETETESECESLEDEET